MALKDFNVPTRAEESVITNYSPVRPYNGKAHYATMNKSRSGTHLLGGLVALQVCSLPEFVHSDQMLRFATYALLGYVAFAVALLLFAARSARPLGFRPRFWTLANLATLILLGIATWTAWRTNYCQLEVTAAATALAGALVHLFRCNARKPDCVQQSHPPR
jgi:hypothetical protein